MAKASTNAGLHPYLRSDTQHLFDHIPKASGGIRLKSTPIKAMDTVVKTEYKDKNGKDLYFKDEVQVEDEKFEIDYDSKQFRWVLKNEKKVIMLKKVCKKTVLVRKCKSR